MMSTCWGLNVKRLILTILAVWACVFASDFLIHGIWLAPVYKSTPTLWRPDAEMSAFMKYIFLGQLVVSIAFSILFAKGYEGKGIGEGIRFGLLTGFYASGFYLIQYAVTPLSCSLVTNWIGSGFGQAIFAGIVASFIYRK